MSGAPAVVPRFLMRLDDRMGWGGFTLAERDRRWSAVRSEAAAADLDVVAVIPGAGADARYLTQLRNACIALPTDGTTPYAVTSCREGSSWLPGIARTGRNWVEPLAEGIRSLGLDGARIGIPGLRNGVWATARAGGGAVIDGAFTQLSKLLPRAMLIDASDTTGVARLVKSEEELECLRVAASFAAAAVERLVDVTYSDAHHSEVYAAVMESLLECGSEHEALFVDVPTDAGLIRYANPAPAVSFPATGVAHAALAGNWGGEAAHVEQSVLLGDRPRRDVRRLAGVFEIVSAAVRQALRPGATMLEVLSEARQVGTSEHVTAGVSIRGCGFGDDGPVVDEATTDQFLDTVSVVEGAVLTVVPWVRGSDGTLIRTGVPMHIDSGGTEPLVSGGRSLEARPQNSDQRWRVVND